MKPPETATRRGAPREPERRPVVASPRTIGVAQTKAATLSHMRPPPASPPAYRPQPLPKVLQLKTAAPQRPFVQPRAGNHAPVPHARHAPRRMPEVMQAKTASARPHASVVQQRQPFAPPAFNAGPRNVLQPKSCAGHAHKSCVGHVRTPNVPPSTNRASFNVVQRADDKKFSFGASASAMTNQQWSKSGMSTFSSVLVENDDDEFELLTLTKNIKTKTYGAEHAEDVAMRNLLESYTPMQLKGLHVILNISKSPCSSTFGTSGAKDPGCAENLIKFVKTYGVNLTLICRGLYNGTKGSQDAVDALRKEGIDVSVDVRTGAQARFGEKKT